MDLDHLKKNNLTYSEHFLIAMKFAKLSFKAFFFFFVHAFVPFIFVNNGSKMIEDANIFIQAFKARKN